MLIARCQPRIRLFKGCVQLYAVVCSCMQLCSVVHTVRINNVPKQCVRLLYKHIQSEY